MKKASPLILPCLAVVVMLWLPYGFHMGGLIEEWGLLGLYSQHGPFFFAGADSLMPQHQMRPLMTTPWAIAYAVDPDSWWFWHVELALSLVIRGAAMSWIAMYLTGSRRLAVVAGLLLMVWPADTMQMAFRALNVGMSFSLIMLSAALLIAAYLSDRLKHRRALSLAAAACIVIGTWMYELTLLLAPLPFLVLYARNGLSGAMATMRGKGGATVAWILGCAVSVMYIGNVLLTAKNTYQQQVAGDESHVVAALEANGTMLFSRGFVRSLLDGWLDAARIVAHDVAHPMYFVVVAIVLGVIVASARRLDVQEGSRTLRIALVGVLVLAMGYAPFLISLAHLSTTQRTFMFASPGSVLIFLAILIILDRVQSHVAAVAGVVLLVLGVAQQLYQFDVYNKLYESQRQVLRSIVPQLKGIGPGKTIVVLDDSQRLNGTWMLDELVPSALTYLTGKPISTALVCLTPQNIWEMRDGLARQGTCVETADSWIFRGPAPVSGPGIPLTKQLPDFVVSKSNAVIVRVPRDLRSGNALLSGHAAVLNPSAWPLQFVLFDKDAACESHHWDFGHRWDLPEATAGSGWKPDEWLYTPFRQTSAAWINQPRATLVFDLHPAAKDYELGIQTLARAASAKDHTTISVNGVTVPVQWTSDKDLSATVSKGILKSGSNTIEFESPASPDYYGLSIFVDQIDLAPKD